MVYYNSMRIRLTPATGVPIYRQIVDQIGHLIAARRLLAGERLPSVRELARALPANQNTVLRAYEILERDGLILRKHGDGTFVSEGGSSLSDAKKRQIVRELLADAAAKAAVFDVPPEELHRLLDQTLSELRKDKGAANE
jgi:GntR family transcriptional regulator